MVEVAEGRTASYRLFIGLTPPGQYAQGPQFEVVSEHLAHLRNAVDEALGVGTYDRLMAQFTRATLVDFQIGQAQGAAVPTPAGQVAGFGPAPAPAAPVPATPPAPQAGWGLPNPQGPKPQMPTYGACPACGIGVLTLRNRRDGSGQFIGCSRYRSDGTGCSYIQNQ